MAYEVIYKDAFLEKVQHISSYLEKEWGLLAAQNFIHKIDKRIESLKKHPFIGAPSKKLKGCRGLHITKHNRLFYKIDGKTIIILNIYDTRRRNY